MDTYGVVWRYMEVTILKNIKISCTLYNYLLGMKEQEKESVEV